MRYLHLLVFACFFSALQPARAQSPGDPSDLFLSVYTTVKDAEKAEQAGNFRGALAKYRYAAEMLDSIAKKDPTWKPEIVAFRKQRIAEALVRVQASVAKYGAGKGGGDGAAALEGGLPTTDDPLTFAPTPEPGGDMPADPAPPTRRAPRKNPPAAVGETDPTVGLGDAITRMKKLQADLRDANAAAARAEQEKKDLVKKFDDAIQARDNSEKQQKVLQSRADAAEERLLKAQSEVKVDVEKIKALQAEASEAKRIVRTARIDQDADAEIRKQLDDRMKAAQAKIAALTEQRNALDKASKDAPMKIKELEQQLDKAKGENKELAGKLADTKTQLADMTVSRNDAMKQLAQLKEAAKNVDKLVADNASLMARLAETEKSVANFKAEGEEKDKQIAALKKEVGSVKEQLAQARTDSANYQKQMGDLQSKLEEQGRQLATAKAESAASATEKKKMQAENDILRGIVLRQQKQEAVRSATKKLVLGELQKLEVNSKTLLKEIDLLSQPVVKLSPTELKLFRKSELQVNGAEISANLPTTEDPPVIADASSQAAAPETKTPEISVPAPEIPKTSDLPVKDKDMDMASAKPVVPTLAPTETGEKPATTEAPAANQGDVPAPNETLGSVAGQPNIPKEYLPMARDGKEMFEKGKYLEAEKIYMKILAKVPNNLYILSNLGVVRFREGSPEKLKQALEVLTKATKVAPEDGFSWCTKGIVEYTLGKLDEAVSSLTKALAINSKNATAHNYLGITAAGKGWQEAAQKELETACTLDSNYADAHFNLAVVFATQTPPNKEKANQYYKRARELGAESDAELEKLVK